MTGLEECTVMPSGQRGSPEVIVKVTTPRPPRQISASLRPASIPPCAAAPRSTRRSPASPVLTMQRKAPASATRHQRA